MQKEGKGNSVVKNSFDKCVTDTILQQKLRHMGKINY